MNRLVRSSRKSVAKITESREVVEYRGKFHNQEKGGRTRQNVYRKGAEEERRGLVWSPCEIREKPGNRLEVVREQVQVLEMQEQRREWRTVPPLDLEVLEELYSLLDNGNSCCVSDASVNGDKKAVTIWFGEYGSEGKIVTRVVDGLPHDSGRGDQ